MLLKKQHEFFSELDNLKNYKFIFYSTSESISETYSNKLQNLASQIPSVYVCKEKQQNVKLTKIFASDKVFIGEELPDIQFSLNRIAQFLDFDYKTNEISSNFIPVSLDYLPNIFHTACDFFIKLSSEKYLKIIKKNNELSVDDIVRIRKSNVTCLYVKTNDFEEFLASINEASSDNNQLDKVKEVDVISKDLSFSHSTFYHLSSKFGLNADAINYANRSVEILYTFMERDENFSSVWKYLMKKQNFISEHSLMTAYLANAILSYTQYKNDNNSVKLSLAAILHDIEIKNEKFYDFEINDNNEDHSLKEITSFRAHVAAAGEILNKFQKIPPDIDKIIFHHHEKYDGSGFPRGLGANKLPILSTIFIVAHEFVIYMAQKNYSENELSNFLQLKKSEYKEGFFKEVIEALEKVR